MTNNQWLRQRICDQLQLPPCSTATVQELALTEWSPLFEQLMRNRLIMGAMRYGRIKDPSKANYDQVASIEAKLRLYRESGNDELLVDIANLALIEFEIGSHPKKHFHAEDDKNHTPLKGART